LKQHFQGDHGKAYLFDTVTGFPLSSSREHTSAISKYIISYINCSRCKTTIGWKYGNVPIISEKYKEGKSLLGVELLVGCLMNVSAK
ncbi:hypothetical protein AOQ84DRAFT_296887, partial [Glonium stellatum]